MEVKKRTERKSQLRRKYDADFKLSAVELILNGQSVTQVSQSLGMAATNILDSVFGSIMISSCY